MQEYTKVKIETTKFITNGKEVPKEIEDKLLDEKHLQSR